MYANTTPLIELDEGDYKNEMYWGTYRPSLYFGMKSRSSNPITTGLMWGGTKEYNTFRHTCEHGDDLQKYGWTHHDGVNFGEQTIIDRKFNLQLKTSFIKIDSKTSTGGSWSNLFTANKIKSNEVTLGYWIYYINFPENCVITKRPKASRKGIEEISISGRCDEIGEFTFIIKESDHQKSKVIEYNDVTKKIKDIPDLSKFHYYGVKLEESNQWRIGEIVKQELLKSLQTIYQNYQKSNPNQADGVPMLIPVLPNTFQKNSNSFVFMKVYDVPYEIEVALISHQSAAEYGYYVNDNIVPADYLKSFFGIPLKQLLSDAKQQFEDQMEKKFNIKDSTGVDETMENTAKYALSNMIGAMGYWEGESLIYEGSDKPPSVHRYEKLFSAVPSRPFFPRGFLWDEGFHQLLISDWNEQITVDVLSHWLNLMHENGWIPREQILGEEARSKVPPEYQPQHRTHANPPTFFMVIDKLVRKANQTINKTTKQNVEDLYSDFKMKDFIENYGSVNNLSIILQFITNAFPRLEKWFNWFKVEQSGLLPNSFRWRGRLENHTLSSGLDDYPRSRYPSEKELHLDLTCWMAYSSKILANAAVLVNKDPSYYLQLHQTYLQTLELHWDDAQGLYADIAEYSKEKTKFVKHVGYVSLFPLLTGLIPADSPRLKSILDVIQDENQLWTPFGLRSLSVSDPYYLRGDNYWTGPIWININYCVVASLHRNYLVEGPNYDQASIVYKTLRKNLMNNIVKVYERSGFIWEQYDQNNGNGVRSKPFTGWSALVLSIMSEKY